MAGRNRTPAELISAGACPAAFRVGERGLVPRWGTGPHSVFQPLIVVLLSTCFTLAGPAPHPGPLHRVQGRGSFMGRRTGVRAGYSPEPGKRWSLPRPPLRVS